jgi:hypothetical protein
VARRENERGRRTRRNLTPTRGQRGCKSRESTRGFERRTQRKLSLTADTYTRVLVDAAEVDYRRLLWAG